MGCVLIQICVFRSLFWQSKC